MVALRHPCCAITRIMASVCVCGGEGVTTLGKGENSRGGVIAHGEGVMARGGGQ